MVHIYCSKTFVYTDLQTELTTLNLKIVIFEVNSYIKKKIDLMHC